MERIDIGKLVIRLRHIEPRLARRAMDGLGSEVLHALVTRGSQRPGGYLQIHQMDLGVLSSSGDSSVADIRQQVSRAVSGAIQAKRMSGEGG